MELPKDQTEYEKALKFSFDRGFMQGSRKSSVEKLIAEYDWNLYNIAEALEDERESTSEKIEKLEKEISEHSCEK